jgi:hypothetical protein
VPRLRELLEARQAAQPVERRHADVEHDRVRRVRARGDEGVEGILEPLDLEALGQRALGGGDPLGVVVDQEDAGPAREQDLGDRVAVAPKEVEDVDSLEAQVAPGRAEVADLAALAPVVDGLEVDLAEARDLDLADGFTVVSHDLALKPPDGGRVEPKLQIQVGFL